MRRAFLARSYPSSRNSKRLPVGAVISLNGKVVAEGRNSIWVPESNPGLHAEIAVLKAVPTELWARSKEMTLYTTPEPCLMCASTILIHHIGRVVFGSRDGRGGVSYVFGHLPPHFEAELQAPDWVGPALPQECAELYKTALAVLAERKSRFSESE